MRIVTLVSGGLDSSVMCSLLAREGYEQVPVFVDYGQLAREKEWNACRRVLRQLGLPRPMRVDLQGYGRTFACGITSSHRRVFEDAFLPGRNMLFLLVGAARAYQESCDAVAIGLLDPRSHLFGDQTSPFLRKAQEVLRSALGIPVRVLAPLIRLNKAEVLALAARLRVKGTYSCHAGGGRPCRVCISCREILGAAGAP